MTIRVFVIALLIIAVAGLSANTQSNASAADSKSASSNSPGRHYSLLDSGRRAQFRIAEPDTKKIAVGISGVHRQLLCNQIGM